MSGDFARVLAQDMLDAADDDEGRAIFVALNEFGRRGINKATLAVACCQALATIVAEAPDAEEKADVRGAIHTLLDHHIRARLSRS